MDGGKQQRAAPIGAVVGQMTLPPLRMIGPGYVNPREPEPDRCRLGRAAGGYVSIIRYNRNRTGALFACLPPVYSWPPVSERLPAAKHFPPCPHFNLKLLV